jgi:hypothetical protein
MDSSKLKAIEEMNESPTVKTTLTVIHIHTNLKPLTVNDRTNELKSKGWSKPNNKTLDVGL